MYSTHLLFNKCPSENVELMEGHCFFLQVLLHAHTWGIPCCEQTNITSMLRPGSILSCKTQLGALRF